MATLKYAAGITPIPPKWAGIVTGALDKAGVSSILITSTFRAIERDAAAMYANVKVSGVEAALKGYSDRFDKVIMVFDAYSKAGRNQADTISAMATKIHEVGPGVHSLTQSDKFCVFDVSPSSVPAEKKKAFESAMRGISSYFIAPGTFDPVYHIELGDKLKQAIQTGAKVLPFIVLIVLSYLYFRRGM